MADDRASEGSVQAHEREADGTLDDIDAVILFPVLGAPCVVAHGNDSYVEVIVALEPGADVSSGTFAHYLQYCPFRDPYPEDEAEAESQLDSTRPCNILVSEDKWALADFQTGQSRELEVHIGTEGARVTLARPVFAGTTCRMHHLVVDKLRDHYPDVYRVLIKTSVFDGNVGQMMELHWVSTHHRDGLMQKVKSNAKSARGEKLDDAAYATMHQRHPFLVMNASALPRKFCHLTDIHNSTAHNLLQLSSCSVLENAGERYTFPVGSRFNNYNRNFSRLAETAQVDARADAYVLTGDIVDYGRGLYFGAANPLLSPPAGITADEVQALMMRAGRADDPRGVLDEARAKLSQKTIWDQMGGDEQSRYCIDANLWYFVLEKILPLYARGKPVFTSLGNHDFHPNPFPPWPTAMGDEDEDSVNAFTPSDYNLTRYEALLAYGPKSYCPYGGSTILSVMTAVDWGGSGLISVDECMMMYFFFVNPWLDYSLRFGDRSIMLIDFGRKEVRPQGAPKGTATPLLVGGLLAVAGAIAAVVGTVIGCPALAVAGAAVAFLGATMVHAALSGGAAAGSFEELSDLPAAQEAMSDDQLKLFETWTGVSDVTSRAMFCHALVLGRAQKLISLTQLNLTSFGGNRFKEMNYGVLAKNRNKVLDAVQSGRVTVTMSGHSHYSSVYILPERGDLIEGAVWPGTIPSPTNRLVVVTPASGPMSEKNLQQDDPASPDNRAISKYIDRQLRAPPGGSLVDLDGGAAKVTPLVADLPQNKPRRAAFDSWKNRLDAMHTVVWRRNDSDWHPSVEDEDIRIGFHYLSDVAPGRTQEISQGGVGPQPTAHWPPELTGMTFFPAGAERFQVTMQPADVDLPTSLSSASQDGWLAHQYEMTMSRAQYRLLKMLAGTSVRLPCAVEYPEPDEDPWIFDLNVVQGSDIGNVKQLHMKKNEFPEFDKRATDLHYDRPFGASPASGTP